MEILKEKILSYIKNSKEKQEVNLLLDELIKESKNRAFDVFRTVKKSELSSERPTPNLKEANSIAPK